MVKKGTECMACLECVQACSNAFYKQFNEDLSCIRIVAGKNGGAKPMTCIQCGKCAKVCEAGAITQNAKGVYMINKKKCVGCGMCAEICPAKAIVMKDGRAVIDRGACIRCFCCQEFCPKSAMKVGRTAIAKIVQKK